MSYIAHLLEQEKGQTNMQMCSITYQLRNFWSILRNLVSLFSSELKNYGNAMRLLNFEMRKFLGGSNSEEICDI